MSDFYKDMQDIATPLLKQFGQGVIQLIRSVEGPADPDSPWQPGDVTTTKITLYGSVSGVKAYQINGTQIEASDLVVMCSVIGSNGKDISPQETDVVLIDGTAHQIKKIEPRPAAGTPVVYAIFVAG